jgi:hypothetical protein
MPDSSDGTPFPPLASAAGGLISWPMRRRHRLTAVEVFQARTLADPRDDGHSAPLAVDQTRSAQ